MNKYRDLIVVAVVVLLGTAVFLGSDQSKQNNVENNQLSPIGSQSNIVSLLNNSIHTYLPDGWTPSRDRMVFKTVNEKNYRIGFQLNPDDYLKGDVYAKNVQTIKKTKTSIGTDVYVIKTADSFVSVSSCQPSQDKGCSLPRGNEFLFILLNEYQPGDQYVRELNFSDPDTNKIIDDFISIIESSDI